MRQDTFIGQREQIGICCSYATLSCFYPVDGYLK